MRLNKLLYQVKATGSTQAVVAVGGTDVAGWARPHLIGAASVLVVTVGSSIGIVVDTLTRRRRDRAWGCADSA